MSRIGAGSGLERGGFAGWWVVAGCFAIYFMAGGVGNTASVYLKPLTQEFGWSRAQVSGVFSLGFVIAGATAALWGRLADRRGPRAALLPGVLLTGTGYALLCQIDSLAGFAAIYALASFASAGISLIPISVMLSNWFVEKRGRAIGAAYAGVGFGSLALTPVVGALVEMEGIGWRGAWALSGVGLVVLLLPVVLLLRNRPEELGLRADGAPAEAEDTARLPSAAAPRAEFSARAAVRTTAFWYIVGLWFVVLMPLSAVNLHQVAFMTDLGLSTTRAAQFAGGVGGMSIVGRLGFGVLADRVPIRTLLSICYAALAVGVALLWSASYLGVAVLFPFVAVLGVAEGGAFALSALLVPRLFGEHAMGEIFGLLAVSATLGGAIGPVAAGLLYDRSGSYEVVLVLGACLAAAGAVAVLFLPRLGPD